MSRSRKKGPQSVPSVNGAIAETVIGGETASIASEYGFDPDNLPPPQEPKPAPQRVELDLSFVANPQRMQYALLLALLLKKGGTARFTAADMEHVDTDFNILYARSLNGQFLEVSVVSAESGIIRSPESEMEAWNQKLARDAAYMQSHPAQFQPIPPAMQFESLAGIGPVFQPSPDRGAGQAVQSPGPALRPPEPADAPETIEPKKTVYQMPFQVGHSPSQAANVDLDQFQATVRQHEQQVLEAQQAAIARVEAGEASGATPMTTRASPSPVFPAGN